MPGTHAAVELSGDHDVASRLVMWQARAPDADISATSDGGAAASGATVRGEFNMLRTFISAATISAALAMGGATGSAQAQSVEEFYQGKTITIVVPFNPGTTPGNLGQAVADHLGEYMPGKPNARVEFMPGAGGLTAQNHVYVTSPRDGTVVLMPNSAIAVSEYLTPEGVEYKTKEFIWLGVVLPTRHVLMVRNDTGVKTFDDLKTTEVFIGSSGAGSETDMYPRLANALMGTKMNVVPGFPGGASDLMLAIEAGEMQGAVSGWQNWANRPDLTAMMVPIMTFGLGRQPEVPDVPNFLEVVTDPEGMTIARFISSVGPIGRGAVTTPEVPQDRVDALRQAFASMMADPKFMEKVKGLNLNLEPTGGAEAQEMVMKALDVPAEVIERARELIAIPAQ
jgi:tripartite-type tricarboxylate transporter receptor subunit TctC